VTVVGLGERRDEWGLVGGAAPGRLPVALSAPIDVVDLDDAGELAVGIALQHDLQQLVLEAPGGVVGHAELELELERGDRVLPLGQQVQRQESDRQRQLPVGEYGARGQRGLVPAVPALQQTAGLDLGVAVGTAAHRADELARPALGNSVSAHCAALP